MKHTFLIIHGLGGSGTDHWQTWLHQELIKRDLHVIYPTFTNFHSPDKDVWLKELSDCMDTIPDNHTITVITHSLGCLLWLHYTETNYKKGVEQAILVAPPSPKIILEQARTFYVPPLNSSKVIHAAKETVLIHSTNDPYCSLEDAAVFSTLGTTTITFPNMGHINSESGHGKWSWILDFCLSENFITM